MPRSPARSTCLTTSPALLAMLTLLASTWPRAELLLLLLLELVILHKTVAGTGAARHSAAQTAAAIHKTAAVLCTTTVLYGVHFTQVLTRHNHT